MTIKAVFKSAGVEEGVIAEGEAAPVVKEECEGA